MPHATKQQVIQRMETAVEHLKRDLGGLRTGRASLALLDGIKVDYYGTPTPLKQVATLGIPESRLITVQPWEPPRASPSSPLARAPLRLGASGRSL